MTPDTVSIDPVSLDVLRARLEGIAAAMQSSLLRSAFSPIVKEGMDASACLLTAEGVMLAQSRSIPLHLGALVPAVEGILDRFPASGMRPGDVYLANDPFSGGTHLPDFTMAMPVFVEGKVAAIAATMLHHQDVGGLRAGSVPTNATEIYQEGLRFPPLRYSRAGERSEDVHRTLLANTRTPDAMEGDLSAQIAAGQAAVERLEEIGRSLGLATLLAGFGALLDRAESMVRSAIRALPDGRYTALDHLDDDGFPDSGPVPVAVSVEISGEDIAFDFAGSGDQVRGPVNCVASGPLAAVYFALLGIAPEGAPANGGVLRAADLRLPVRSVVNASAPAAVNARMATVKLCTAVVLQALAKAAPDRMPAANAGMSVVLAFGGVDENGQRYVSSEIVAGGGGALSGSDGADGISTDIGNAMNMPAEAVETAAPLRLLEAEVRPDSGGEGRYRGGLGVRRVYEALADDIAVTHRSERFLHVPMGLDGGGSPLPSRASVERSSGGVETLTSKASVTLNRGDRLIVETCGGAGHGPVVERDQQALERDGLAGKISV